MVKNEIKKIKILKNRLTKIHKNYHLDIYKIFSEIYNIRQKKNKKYSLVNLSDESIISGMFDYHYVVTIMEIRRITKTTMKLVDKGIFTIFDIANALRKSRILHIPKEQNKFFREMAKKVKDYKLTIKGVRDEVTLLNNGFKKNMNSEDSWILQTVYEIRTVKRYIIDRFKFLSDINKSKIEMEVAELHNFIEGNHQKEITSVPISKVVLKQLRAIKIKGIGGLNHTQKIERLIEHYNTKDKVICCGCKLTFTKKRRDQKYCSSKCKSKYNNKKVKL